MELSQWLLTVAAVVFLAWLVRRNRPTPLRGKTPRRPARPSRSSLFVTAWNSSGARRLDSTTLTGGVAEIAGRASGAGARGAARVAAGGGRRLGSGARRGFGAARQRAGSALSAAKRRLWAHPPRQEEGEDTGSPPARRPPSPVRTPAAGPTKARHAPTNGDPVTAVPPAADQMPAVEAPPPPPEWAILAALVADFEPESDAELLRFIAGQSAGLAAYGEAWAALHETCVNTLGMDPSSVQGVAEIVEHGSEFSSRIAAAHARIVAVYREVMEAVQNGVVMPFRGRFFKGD